MTFLNLGLIEPIVRAVAAEGYTAPTPIQAQAIPAVLSGRDVLGSAQTGTGKTGAFALPILHRLAESDAPLTRGRRPRALVLSPTRELATQILDSFASYGRGLRLRHTVVYGGVGKGKQIRDLQNGVDVVVATPGRLQDLQNQGFVDLSAIETLVLDEADHMLDMGFIRDIQKIVRTLPQKRQTLFFSATMPKEIRRLADELLTNPICVEAAPVATAAEAIDQSVYYVARENKPALLERLLQAGDMTRTLVFTRTKHGADKLVKGLQRAGIHSAAIHGNKNQNARARALGAFKAGRLSVLIATDIAARGIDVDQVSHVVNYDMPNVAETYVHRIGRTARAGAEGIALSFCDRDELGDLRSIERLIGDRLDVARNAPDLVYDAPAARHSHTHPNAKNAPRKPIANRPSKGGPRPRRTGPGAPASKNASGARRTPRRKPTRKP